MDSRAAYLMSSGWVLSNTLTQHFLEKLHWKKSIYYFKLAVGHMTDIFDKLNKLDFNSSWLHISSLVMTCIQWLIEAFYKELAAYAWFRRRFSQQSKINFQLTCLKTKNRYRKQSARPEGLQSGQLITVVSSLCTYGDVVIMSFQPKSPQQ